MKGSRDSACRQILSEHEKEVGGLKAGDYWEGNFGFVLKSTFLSGWEPWAWLKCDTRVHRDSGCQQVPERQKEMNSSPGAGLAAGERRSSSLWQHHSTPFPECYFTDKREERGSGVTALLTWVHGEQKARGLTPWKAICSKVILKETRLPNKKISIEHGRESDFLLSQGKFGLEESCLVEENYSFLSGKRL